MEQALETPSEVQQTSISECGRCGKSIRQGRGFAFKVAAETNIATGVGQAGQITKCILCAVRHWAMLKRSLTVAVVVGTILTFLNQGDIIFAGEWKTALYWKVPLTYCVPFCVATYGALSNSRR